MKTRIGEVERERSWEERKHQREEKENWDRKEEIGRMPVGKEI